VAKTFQVRRNTPQGEPPLTIDGQNIEVVEDFKYLGSFIASSEKDIKARIGLGWAAFNKLRTILTSKLISIDHRLRIFDAACISILLYGCESWTLTPELTNKLDVFSRTCYRIMLGIKQQVHRVTNDELYRMVARCELNQIVRERQLKFIGHCLRMSDDEPVKIYALHQTRLTKSKPVGKYFDQIARYLISDKRTEKPCFDEIVQWAQDKSAWRYVATAPKPKHKPCTFNHVPKPAPALKTDR
jgi:hypothetical protein